MERVGAEGGPNGRGSSVVISNCTRAGVSAAGKADLVPGEGDLPRRVEGACLLTASHCRPLDESRPRLRFCSTAADDHQTARRVSIRFRPFALLRAGAHDVPPFREV